MHSVLPYSGNVCDRSNRDSTNKHSLMHHIFNFETPVYLSPIIDNHRQFFLDKNFFCIQPKDFKILKKIDLVFSKIFIEKNETMYNGPKAGAVQCALGNRS
ncbi:MAG: hypothetical protein HQK53_11080 [Oligoflexia bacterium]|nr:hypothetical protein [Oligoflexia bacterium]